MTTPAPPQRPAIGPQRRELLESGCALSIATVGPDGRPHVGRAWGLTVLDDGAARVRLLLDADDTTIQTDIRAGSRLAVNCTDVRTLVSMQAKGRVTGLEEATASDRRRMQRHSDRFWGAVEEVDGFPRRMTAHLVPRHLTACIAELDEWYDQTPGPNAGRRIAGSETTADPGGAA